MTNQIKKRITEPKPEEKKQSGPTPESLKAFLNPKATSKVKVISQLELAMVATVLDFTSNDWYSFYFSPFLSRVCKLRVFGLEWDDEESWFKLQLSFIDHLSLK